MIPKIPKNILDNRWLLLMVVFVGLSFAFVGCSNNNSIAPSNSETKEESSASKKQAKLSSEESTTAWPRTYVDNTKKEVVIEKQPERVAVLHFGQMEFLFALGINPAGSTWQKKL